MGKNKTLRPGVGLGACEIAGSFLDIGDDSRDALHLGSVGEEFGLRQPERLFDETVVHGARVALDPSFEGGFAVDALIVRVLREREDVGGGVESRVAAADGDALFGEGLDKFRAREPGEGFGVVAKHVEVPRAPGTPMG